MVQAGLVLEGGGLRGTYTSGVLDAFLDAEIEFPYIIGVSAGVCNAVSFISRQRGRSARMNIEHCQDKEYYSFRNVVKTGGVFNEKMIFDKMPHQLYPFDYAAYRRYYQKLIAGTTDCITGQAVYYELNDLKNQYEIVKASSWLPFVSKMVSAHGRKLLDGGIADSIPIEKSIADGNQKNVIVLTQPEGYRKAASASNRLSHLVYRHYPNLVKALNTRPERYNETLQLIEQLEQEGKAIVIRPSRDLGLSRLERDPQKILRACRLGYRDGKAKIAQIKEFF